MNAPPYRCAFCGAPSWLHPCDQEPPADYCGEMHHGEPEVTELDGDEAADAWDAATGHGELGHSG